MRAAAVALALIVGAAVVLWYGNTLNSWVLGGLIGGLAALLISIPISLLLFSYLARRNDERAKAEAEEEMSLAARESYNHPVLPVEVYEAHAYTLPSADDEEEREDEPAAHRVARGRNLPVARQRQLAAPASQRYQQQGAVPAAHVKGQAASTQRLHPKTGQPMRYPGFPGYRIDAQRSAYRTAALRAARYEAAQQHAAGDAQIVSAPAAKRLPVVRSDQRIVAQHPVQPRVPRQARPSQPLQAQAQAPQQYRSCRTVDGSAVHTANNRSLTIPAEVTGGQQASQGRYVRAGETQTDKIGGFTPLTSPVRQQTTDQLARNSHIDARWRNPDVVSGSLKNPLVRRAPYMYEDDPLRQEMAQHIEAPLVRRSSRYENYDEDEA